MRVLSGKAPQLTIKVYVSEDAGGHADDAVRIDVVTEGLIACKPGPNASVGPHHHWTYVSREFWKRLSNVNPEDGRAQWLLEQVRWATIDAEKYAVLAPTTPAAQPDTERS